MDKKRFKDSYDKVAALQGLLVMIIAVITLEATGIVQHVFSQKTMRAEASSRAEDQMEIVERDIYNIIDQTETAIRNNMWIARIQVAEPDSLWDLAIGIVEDNPFICGSTVALVENYAPSKGRLFAPYACRKGDGIVTTQLGTEEYDYLHQEWFVKALENPEGYWSEPYFDTGGAESFITTYSVPVRDNSGRIAAVMTADVSLGWLTSKLDQMQLYPHSFNLMVSRSGKMMVCPAETLVMNHTIRELTADLQLTDDFDPVEEMMSSENGGYFPIRYQGKVRYVFFNPIVRTGWVMSVVIPEEEIFAASRKVATRVFLLQVLGILILIQILWATLKNQKRLHKVNVNKKRMEGELQVASNIQMSMIPKSFPPFPERSDLDIYATIVPAKEVGGDLYDFFIQDNRLYFCIGDVSGKGIPASLVMAVTRSLFRTIAPHERSPQRILNMMNDSMSDTNEYDMFVTFFCGVLDLAKGHLRYCNAGHNAPYLVGGGQPRELPVEANLPLGVMRGIRFIEQETDLSSGYGLFLYTDGLNEAENVVHEQFGGQRIEEVLGRDIASSKQELTAMMEAVNNFVGDAPQSDDLTLLYIRFLNPDPDCCKERHLILHNDIQQIPQLASFVESIADLARMDVGTAMSLNLALEEAVANVIQYAYPAGSDGLVDIEAIICPGELKLIISDSGVPFDPTAAPEVDITLSAEERPIGGLGIFLVRQIMDTVSYLRAEGKNILTMTKKLSA